MHFSAAPHHFLFFSAFFSFSFFFFFFFFLLLHIDANMPSAPGCGKAIEVSWKEETTPTPNWSQGKIFSKEWPGKVPYPRNTPTVHTRPILMTRKACPRPERRERVNLNQSFFGSNPQAQGTLLTPHQDQK